VSYPLTYTQSGSGSYIIDEAGENLGAHKLVYRGAADTWLLADADVVASTPVVGLTLAPIGAGLNGRILFKGYVGDKAWSWTTGGPSGLIYASTTPGELTQTPPSGAGDRVQVVAVAFFATGIWFNPAGLGEKEEYPEKLIHQNHWDTNDEIIIAAAGAGGEQSLGGAVAVGKARRIREVTVQHLGTQTTTISILDQSGGNVVLSFDVSAQATRVWSSEDGRLIGARLQPVIQSSNVTGGNTVVFAAGIEASPYEIWVHDKHWGGGAQLDLDAAATPQSLGAAVTAGETRRVREITVRHAGSNNTVVELGVDLGGVGEEVKLIIDVPANTTRVWSSEDGRMFGEGEQPEIQTSDVTGGHTFVSASGVEAA